VVQRKKCAVSSGGKKNFRLYLLGEKNREKKIGHTTTKSRRGPGGGGGGVVSQPTRGGKEGEVSEENSFFLGGPLPGGGEGNFFAFSFF